MANHRAFMRVEREIEPRKGDREGQIDFHLEADGVAIATLSISGAHVYFNDDSGCKYWNFSEFVNALKQIEAKPCTHTQLRQRS